MIPKIIHQVHFGGKPSKKLGDWMNTVRDLHPDWDYLLWDEHNLPLLKLNLQELQDSFPKWAGVSNAVRLKAILDFGGVYLDTDCECLKPLNPLLEQRAFAALQDERRLCNAVFGAEAGHFWIAWQWTHVHEWTGHAADWGVELMSLSPRKNLTVLPAHAFYPFLWDAPQSKRSAHADSYLVHHWEKSWL